MPATDTALSRTEAWIVALAATLAMSISYVDRQALSVLAPTVTKALAISDAAYGWLGSAFAIAYLLAGPFAGVLVDRAGARRSLPIAILLWSAIAALHAVVPAASAFAVLFALRLALGVSESPSFPAGAQIVQRVLPRADRARGMSTLFIGMSVGGMLAPPIAIALATRFSWRAGFVGTACVALLWLPLWLVLSRRPAARAALDARPPASRAVRTLEVATHPAMLRGLVGLLAIVPTSAFMMAWEAKFYVRQFGLAQGDLAGYLVLSAVVYDAGALLFGDLASRRARARGPADTSPHRLLFACGALLAMSGMLVLAFAPTPHAALAGMALGAAGRGAVITLVNSDTLARMPQQLVAGSGGIIASAQSLGAIVVNPLIGTVVQHQGYGGILLALAAWTIPGCAAWIAWRAPAPEG
jgi:ACS family hexuronate transporter-like MFS transporter